MKTKNIATLFLLLFCFTIAAAQQNVSFWRNDDIEVSTRDSSDFIRVISEPDSGTTLFNLKEYYKNGTTRMIAKTSTTGLPVLQGQLIAYYPSGKRRFMGEFKDNKIIGHAFTFFPNGRLYVDKEYSTKKTPEEYRIIASNDSTGKELVTNGKGHYVNYYSDCKTIIDEGDVKDGVKQGVWTGRFYFRNEKGRKIDSVDFTENYNKGVLKLGESVDASHVTYKYTKEKEEPEYPGGMDRFYVSTIHNLRYPDHYPDDDKKNNMQGTVYVSFLIELDGSLTNVTAVKGTTEQMKEESVAAVKKSPKWQAGKMYGKPVRVSYTVPINFNPL